MPLPSRAGCSEKERAGRGDYCGAGRSARQLPLPAIVAAALRQHLLVLENDEADGFAVGDPLGLLQYLEAVGAATVELRLRSHAAIPLHWRMLPASTPLPDDVATLQALVAGLSAQLAEREQAVSAHLRAEFGEAGPGGRSARTAD